VRKAGQNLRDAQRLRHYAQPQCEQVHHGTILRPKTFRTAVYYLTGGPHPRQGDFLPFVHANHLNVYDYATCSKSGDTSLSATTTCATWLMKSPPVLDLGSARPPPPWPDIAVTSSVNESKSPCEACAQFTASKHQGLQGHSRGSRTGKPICASSCGSPLYTRTRAQFLLRLASCAIAGEIKQWGVCCVLCVVCVCVNFYYCVVLVVRFATSLRDSLFCCFS